MKQIIIYISIFLLIVVVAILLIYNFNKNKKSNQISKPNPTFKPTPNPTPNPTFKPIKCLNNCSGHGICDSKTGTCTCDLGYTENDCHEQILTSQQIDQLIKDFNNFGNNIKNYFPNFTDFTGFSDLLDSDYNCIFDTIRKKLKYSEIDRLLNIPINNTNTDLDESNIIFILDTISKCVSKFNWENNNIDSLFNNIDVNIKCVKNNFKTRYTYLTFLFLYNKIKILKTLTSVENDFKKFHDIILNTTCILKCKNNCSSHGKCTGELDSTESKIIISSCLCDTGYTDDDCSQKKCLNNCSGNGFCNKDGTCSCNLVTKDPAFPGQSWTGEDCSSKSCINNCYGHGTCNKNGVCSCKKPWSGDNCTDLDPKTCDSGFYFNGIECEVCQLQEYCKDSLNYKCPHYYFSPYKSTSGENCIFDPTTIKELNYCSGHGKFIDNGKGIGVCSCDPGYGGVDCYIELNNCSGNGKIMEDKKNNVKWCECNPKYIGDDCSVKRY